VNITWTSRPPSDTARGVTRDVKDNASGPSPVVRASVTNKERRKEYMLYNTYMEQRTMADVRQHLAEVVDHVRSQHAPVYVTRRGRPLAALVGAEDFARILELAEDMEDIQAAEAARQEMRETQAAPIPWDVVKADLGLA
jgi:prevent-host-death family protein